MVPIRIIKNKSSLKSVTTKYVRTRYLNLLQNTFVTHCFYTNEPLHTTFSLRATEPVESDLKSRFEGLESGTTFLYYSVMLPLRWPLRNQGCTVSERLFSACVPMTDFLLECLPSPQTNLLSLNRKNFQHLRSS